MIHHLVDNELKVEHTKQGVGVVARCICGWSSGLRFSGFLASAAFQDHKDEEAKKEQVRG